MRLTLRHAWLLPGLLLGCAGGDDDDDDDDRDSADVLHDDDPCPVGAWDPESLSWTDLRLGQVATQQITLLNNCDGETALDVQASSDDTHFTVSSGSLSIAPGTTSVLAVEAKVDDYDIHEGKLTLVLNDEKGLVVLRLTAAADQDQDGDGYTHTSDCDDQDPSANPGIEEIWYDGVDQDCDGNDDDQDGDGEDAFAYGGDDCDDTDPTTLEGTAEVRNGLDDDCDGSVDEGLVEPGDVIITEVMAAPSAVSDTYGEWIELYNAGAASVDLNTAGWSTPTTAACSRSAVPSPSRRATTRCSASTRTRA